jgi:biopolymer transport protein ExbD
MSMNVGSADGDEDELQSSINTTPLVDVMLVLLIIFLITIPVVTHTIPLSLPKELNVPTQTKPENLNISVDKSGTIFLNTKKIDDLPKFQETLNEESQKVPQPEVHIRGDADAQYESIGRVVYMCQRAAISKIGFITEPPARN